jgi:Tn3 transposase DDE domain
VTASLFISKLQAYPRQNVLARALQEYGRLVKTRFILRQSEDYRRRIHAQLRRRAQLPPIGCRAYTASAPLHRTGPTPREAPARLLVRLSRDCRRSA